MKEYANGSKTLDKRFFGFWLSSARMVIEHAFGRLKAHFGCLPLIMDIRLGELPVVIHSCCTQWTHPRRFAIDLTSKFHMESLSKLHRFERPIHVEIMTSIRRGNLDMDSTFKIDEISMSSLCGFFDVVSKSNRRNFCTCCFHYIIS